MEGVSDKTVVVSTGMGGGDCGYEFKEGERYFVYAYGNSSSLSTYICSRTELLSAAGDDLSALGEGEAPLSRPDALPGAEWWLNFLDDFIFIIILAAIILVLIIYKVISSRKKVS